jgi:hypothetical protein
MPPLTGSSASSHLSRTDFLPYSEAIKCLERLQTFPSPRDKLQCLSDSFASLKTAIVDHWRGRVELTTMDDVLPLTIYAVAMVRDLARPASELNLMDDFIRCNDRGLEYERKLLTNFEVAISYINHEWEIPT